MTFEELEYSEVIADTYMFSNGSSFEKFKNLAENRFEKMQHYCNKNGIFHLFIAHHFDDNIETFLLRKIAGSNFEGLNCMQKNILFNKVKIIRPLLSFTKKQLINYNKKMKLEYFEDPSNKDRKYTLYKK